MADTKEIERAVAEFYQALNTLFTGNVNPMRAIWSHADDVTYLGPQGGILVGWQEVLESWEKQAALNLGGKVEPRDLHILKEDSIAIAQNYEIGTNFVYDREHTVKIRAANIFRKEGGAWKMITHQTDPLAFLNK